MSLIRDEDRYCPIMGIFTFVSFLSFCYHRSILVLHACTSVLCAFCAFRCSASPLGGRGPVHSEHLCLRALLYEPVSRRSLCFEQSCKLAVSHEAETTLVVPPPDGAARPGSREQETATIPKSKRLQITLVTKYIPCYIAGGGPIKQQRERGPPLPP